MGKRDYENGFIYHEVKVKSLSHVQLFVSLRTVAYKVPPSMEFSRQEYWSGLPIPSPGDLPDPGMEHRLITDKESTCQCRKQVLSLGWEAPLEKELATHSSTLAWEITWTEEPDILQSMELQRVGHD